MTTVFQSELWMRPESHHLHASNHAYGMAVDVTAPPFPIGPLRIKSGYRSLEEQRQLLRDYINRPPTMVAISRVAPVIGHAPKNLRAPVVLWGGRKGSLQFGSPEDRFIARWRKRRANLYRIQRMAETALLKRELLGHRTPAMEGLIEMGRMLEEMTWA